MFGCVKNDIFSTKYRMSNTSPMAMEETIANFYSGGNIVKSDTIGVVEGLKKTGYKVIPDCEKVLVSYYAFDYDGMIVNYVKEFKITKGLKNDIIL